MSACMRRPGPFGHWSPPGKATALQPRRRAGEHKYSSSRRKYPALSSSERHSVFTLTTFVLISTVRRYLSPSARPKRYMLREDAAGFAMQATALTALTQAYIFNAESALRGDETQQQPEPTSTWDDGREFKACRPASLLSLRSSTTLPACHLTSQN